MFVAAKINPLERLAVEASPTNRSLKPCVREPSAGESWPASKVEPPTKQEPNQHRAGIKPKQAAEHPVKAVVGRVASERFDVSLAPKIGSMVAAAINPAEVRLGVANNTHVIFLAAREKSVMNLSFGFFRLYAGQG